jgi:hypothetical protein
LVCQTLHTFPLRFEHVFITKVSIIWIARRIWQFLCQ